MGHVTCTEQVKATPEQVWAILSDVTRLPDWAYTEGRFPHPIEAKFGSEQQAGAGVIWVGVSTDGQTATQKITVWEPCQKLVYELQEVNNAPLEMAQINTFDLEAIDDCTKVTWSVDWSVKSGFSLNSLLIRFTGDGAFEEMMIGSLVNLKRLVEQESAGQASNGNHE